MRVGNNERDGERRSASKSVVSSPKAEMVPLYDFEQFYGLIQRERARADRAAARSPHGLPHRAARREAPKVAPVKGAKPTPEDVWGATTHNREFSLVIFRPISRNDRAGLVELLQAIVRTTDAVGVIDNRRLGVLLPDTAAENAVHFVKKVLSQATEQSVHLSHIVHTYPSAWPAESSPLWQEPRRSTSSGGDSAEPNHPTNLSEQTVSQVNKDRRVVKALVGWLQSAALRRQPRRASRASV